MNDSRIVDDRCVKKYAPMSVPGWIEIEVRPCFEAMNKKFTEPCERYSVCAHKAKLEKIQK